MPSDLPEILGPEWVMKARRLEHALSPGVPLAEVTVRPGPEPLGLELHSGLELGLMLSGTAERHFQSYVVPGIPGDVWLCAMWEPHGRRVTSAQEENIVLMFLPDYLGEETLGDLPWLSLFAAPPEQRPRVTTDEMRAEVLSLGEEMKQEILRKRRGWETALRLSVLKLLFTLSRDWRPPDAGRITKLSTTNLSRIMPALTTLHTTVAHRVSLPEAAAACGLSRSRFSLLFHETMGLSFSKFCLRARLAVVAQKLVTTDLSTEDIATQLDFVDASHLHRCFARHYGCTPAVYRRRAR
jgi:AraC-like DNA-binding protein